jgi:hypothetical protein
MNLMDAVITAVYASLLRHHDCSVDDILETPNLCAAFLSEARSVFVDVSERDLLHRLTILRKRSKLPRRSDLNVPQPDPHGPVTTAEAL